jgi:pilus assembly protein CpaE
MKRQFSATFVDCGSSFDEPTIAALEMADRVIVVCTPELNTLRDVRECQRVFGEIIHLDLKRVCFVFNHNQPFAVLAREQFEAALEQPMSFELPHAGEAAYKAASRGEPLVLSNSGSAYAKAIEKLARGLVPAEPKSAHKRSFKVVGHASPRKPVAARNQSGLLGALRGKRAS